MAEGFRPGNRGCATARGARGVSFLSAPAWAARPVDAAAAQAADMIATVITFVLSVASGIVLRL
jgi:hypothetical protein